ncbi:pilus assembly protein [Rhizobium sp. EC-SD404]|uniref:TadE/TadG family type IV pilus assembly protein n=1 Tax=Rhizobium sp. EC-SD404 TaxID=2038389 RepID=UPI00125FC609|nr:pilus assembly protein [Rhizobium sp. EC-SD404]
MKRFLEDRSGQFAMMFGISLPVMLLAAGMAIDTSRMMAAKTALQNNVDAALLAATRFNDRDQTRESYFESYLSALVSSEPTISNIQTDFDDEIGANFIRTEATATADVALTIMHTFTGRTARISVSSDAYEATDALEVVMVLDNTGSMATNNRIAALRKAATTLVETLETVAENNPNRRIRMALVPFVTGVNIRGPEFDCSWIDVNAVAEYHGANFDSIQVEFDRHGAVKDSKYGAVAASPCAIPAVSSANASNVTVLSGNRGSTGQVKANHMRLFHQIGVTWKGCVEARPRTVTVDAAPTTGSTLFVPYFAPDEPDKDSTRSNADTPFAGNNSANLNTSYLTDQITGTFAVIQRSLAKYNATNPKLPFAAQGGPLTGGPNRACPTPVQPLTDDFTALKTAVSQMREWNGSGTNVAEGLAWGTRVLSPEAPYTTGDPFATEGTKKIVVLLTDGENVVYGSSNTVNKSDYGSNGFMSSNRFGTTNQGTAARTVDGWTKENCTMLKNNGVEIYTVLLQADTANNRAVYSSANGGCASAPENYFPTNDVSRLDSVFARIGSMVAQLHFTN